jgi:UDP-N-acetylmuramoyl-tripeptide--D-alanyl-D-alanine ligase
MMNPLSLRTIAQVCSGYYSGADIFCERVNIDSRRVEHGDLFIALRGDVFDAHDFLVDAEKAGATAALVEKRQANCLMPQVLVSNTLIALGELAAFNRAAFKKKVIALTGSAGKTTTKEMIAAILAQTGNPLVTEGNLNNHIGVPLTLLRLALEHESAVIEMGASGLGDISYLSKMAKPDIALVSNVAAAHIAGFGSIENVALGKKEIFDGLAANGVAIINLDNAYTANWLADTAAYFSVLTYSIEKKADVFAAAIKQTASGMEFTLCYGGEVCLVSLAFLGRHNVANAVAAAACCLALGKSLPEVASGLQRAKPYKGRLQRKKGLNGCLIVDDSYNANPASLQMAIDSLMACGGEPILVLGDMAELGADAASMHRAAGEYAHLAGVKKLLAYGELSKATVAGFGEGARHFADWQSLADACLLMADSDAVFLVKGSRSAGMERVVNALVVSEKTMEKEKI